MKRSWIVILFVALIAAGCGGAAVTEQASPTPAPTDTPVPTDTPQAPSAYDVARQYEGRWAGSWNNDTYGTTGGVEATVVVNPDGTFEVTLDVNGMVFGAIDPPAVTFSGTYEAGVGATFGGLDDPTFGDASVTITPDGQVSANLEGVMGGAGSVEVSGTVTPERIDLQYSIPTFSAAGTVTLEHQ